MLNNNHIGYLHFWCQKVLPLVYDNSLSYLEVLFKVKEKLNEVIKFTNQIPEYIDKKFIEEFDEEHLKELISEVFRTIEDAISANNEGTNTHFSKDYPITGTLVWHDNKLYKTMHPIDAGDAVLPNSNIELVNFGDMFNEFISEVKDGFTANDDGTRETASEDRVAHDLVWLDNKLYETTKAIAQGNAYIYSGDNQNVKETTLDDIYEYLLGLINDEVEARSEGDTTLDSKIDDEIIAREQGDKNLSEDLADEVTAREKADTELSGDIADERTAREEADTLLSAADTSLGGRIDALDAKVDNINARNYKTLYDYGYTSGSNLTQYVQAFINDDSASELYLYMDGIYTVNALDMSGVDNCPDKIKRFTKSANTIVTGDGANQMGLATMTTEVAEINSSYSTGGAGYPWRVVRNSDAAHPVTGEVQSNAMFIDNINNSDDGFYHWNLLAQSNIRANTSGQNCAAYFQTHVYEDNENWALATENILHISEETRSTRGIEISLTGNSGVSSRGGKRIGIHIANNTTGSGFNSDYAIYVTSYSTSTGFRRILQVESGYSEIAMCFTSMYTCVYGIDFHECNVNGAAIRLGKSGGHCIQFDGFTMLEENQLGVDVLAIKNGSNNLGMLLTEANNASGIAKYINVIYNGNGYKIPLYQ
jgi:hypothetical protein